MCLAPDLPRGDIVIMDNPSSPAATTAQEDRRARHQRSGDAADPLATQPITFARADAPPMLLVTFTGDTEVKLRNAEALAARLKALGAPVTLWVYPGLSHEAVAMALAKPFRGKGPVLADSATFLHAQLGRLGASRRALTTGDELLHTLPPAAPVS